MRGPLAKSLRPTLGLWLLALGAKFLFGCTADAHGEEGPAREPPAQPTAAAPPGPAATSSEAARSLEAALPAEPRTKPAGLLLSAIGDCTLGDPAGAELAPGSFHRAFDDGDMAAPFSRVQKVLAADDLTIANLETTLTVAAPRTDLPFSFRGKPEFVKMLSLGSVEIVNLANNHASDCGFKGMEETKANLFAGGVGSFGNGAVDTRVIHGITVHNLGYLGGRLEVLAQMQAEVRKHKRPDELVIVSFHWGIEESHAVLDIQQKLGRGAIDAGADLVLGHHPHVLQGIESYKGRKIVYSLGNFVFGGNAQPDDIDSMIYQARFELKDGAIAQVSEQLIPVWITGIREQNDFRPMLLSGADADKVIARVEAFAKQIPGQRPQDLARKP